MYPILSTLNPIYRFSAYKNSIHISVYFNHIISGLIAFSANKKRVI